MFKTQINHKSQCSNPKKFSYNNHQTSQLSRPFDIVWLLRFLSFKIFSNNAFIDRQALFTYAFQIENKYIFQGYLSQAFKPP